jgi:hypothetical protein
MTLNVHEANDLNRLLRWAMGIPGSPSDDEATTAARFLAARSLKAIGAGIRPEEITLTRAPVTSPLPANPDPADPAVAVQALRDLTRVIIYGDGSGLEDVAIDRCDRMSGMLATIDAWFGSFAADARQALAELAKTAAGDSNDDEIEAGRECADLLEQILAVLGYPVTKED